MADKQRGEKCNKGECDDSQTESALEVWGKIGIQEGCREKDPTKKVSKCDNHEEKLSFSG